MTLEGMLRWLYAHEINCELGCFWDGGWWARLGDSTSGYKARADCFYDLQELADWLKEQAEKHYPLLRNALKNEYP